MPAADRYALRNHRALDRLLSALPEPFPDEVWRHALSLRTVPPTPSRAMEVFWHADPLRADRLARAFARRSGAPPGWTWRIAADREGGLPPTHRQPPAPYREAAHDRGPGHCCVCGGPVFRLGWHEDLWGEGVSRRARWHGACVVAWKLWTNPAGHDVALKRAQGRLCPRTGKRLLKSAEVDHRVPLYRVWREHRDRPWPDLLDFWGAPNLQVIAREAHLAKTAGEAGDRARRRAGEERPAA